MEKFTTLTAIACPLGLSNVDTDQLLPARFLKIARAAGLGGYLLHDLRRDEAGHERPDFPLNKPQWRDARILVAGRNFGGGSSREAAVYAIVDSGIRCVIAPSFGDIFSQNAVKNGLLAAVVSEKDASEISAAIAGDPRAPVMVDLEGRTIGLAGSTYAFLVDSAARQRLLNGWDDLDLTRSFGRQIADFRSDDCSRNAWKYF
jgi:3-isopropylmalate/(R)-2-methylmalate dehydratase small subunit